MGELCWVGDGLSELCVSMEGHSASRPGTSDAEKKSLPLKGGFLSSAEGSEPRVVHKRTLAEQECNSFSPCILHLKFTHGCYRQLRPGVSVGGQ